ncbi:MAG: YicC/YloC family endoribonuclease [Steroidobacteraceae bacterium]
MITSMTGFARREQDSPLGQLVCELRSVNHRFLEAGFRLPEELRGLETELRQRLGAALKRGKVDCTMHLRPAAAGARAMQLDAAALARVLEAVRDVAQQLPAQHSVDVMEVLRWPGVVRDDPVDRDSLFEAARQLFEATVAELAAARAREGERLAEAIEQRCAALGEIVAQLRARAPELQARVRARLAEKIADLGTQVDAERFEQEVVLLLQRLDVAEELDRLAGHVDETRRIMRAGEPAGRRLDFLMQELNREANTLSSKSQELDTTRLAVDMKVLIEQMREQVQNIE